MRNLALGLIGIVFLAGCGSDDSSNPCGNGFSCTPTVEVGAFAVYGNMAAANGREQINANINDGRFQMFLKVESTWADDARIWVSSAPNYGITTPEKELVHMKCGYYPFCTFDLHLNCNYSLTNIVSCAGVGGTGNIQYTYTDSDISSLLTGPQTDLYIVLIVNANGANPARNNIPVTFRHI